jgi:hypothetical protein
MNYEHKYRKYKLKYLRKKNIGGGRNLIFPFTLDENIDQILIIIGDNHDQRVNKGDMIVKFRSHNGLEQYQETIIRKILRDDILFVEMNGEESQYTFVYGYDFNIITDENGIQKIKITESVPPAVHRVTDLPQNVEQLVGYLTIDNHFIYPDGRDVVL